MAEQVDDVLIWLNLVSVFTTAPYFFYPAVCIVGVVQLCLLLVSFLPYGVS